MVRVRIVKQSRCSLLRFYCLTTSYRQEQNPVEGRHELIFPMFEFEMPGTFDDLLKMESDLCTHLGFKTDHGRYIQLDNIDFVLAGRYLSMCGKYTASDNILTDYHESLMYKEYGDVFFLTHFPIQYLTILEHEKITDQWINRILFR